MLTADQEEFLEHRLIEFTAGCWNWLGARKKPDVYTRNGGGYPLGTCIDTRRNGVVHRSAYRIWKGPIPEGLQIDHLCRNRACVNPSHLEVVTGSVNQLRRYAHITHCPHGHPYDEANTYFANGARNCKACRLRNKRIYRARMVSRAKKERPMVCLDCQKPLKYFSAKRCTSCNGRRVLALVSRTRKVNP